MNTEEPKKNKEAEEDSKEKESSECEDCDCKNKDNKEVEELKAKIFILEAELEKFKREHNDKILEFVDKKSKEAAEIIETNKREFEERCKQEFDDKVKFFYSKQLSELVEVVSQFEMVINGVTDPSVAAYLVGFKMFLSQFESLLDSFSISPIVPKEGDEFDSDTMEATSTKKVSNKEMDNKIVSVFKKGYKLHNRVIKLSSVEVGKL